MGQAKQRGTFQDRVEQAKQRASLARTANPRHTRTAEEQQAMDDARDDRRYAFRHPGSLIPWMAAASLMCPSPRY